MHARPPSNRLSSTFNQRSQKMTKLSSRASLKLVCLLPNIYLPTCLALHPLFPSCLFLNSSLLQNFFVLLLHQRTCAQPFRHIRPCTADPNTLTNSSLVKTANSSHPHASSVCKAVKYPCRCCKFHPQRFIPRLKKRRSIADPKSAVPSRMRRCSDAMRSCLRKIDCLIFDWLADKRE